MHLSCITSKQSKVYLTYFTIMRSLKQANVGAHPSMSNIRERCDLMLQKDTVC